MQKINLTKNISNTEMQNSYKSDKHLQNMREKMDCTVLYMVVVLFIGNLEKSTLQQLLSEFHLQKRHIRLVLVGFHLIPILQNLLFLCTLVLHCVQPVSVPTPNTFSSVSLNYSAARRFFIPDRTPTVVSSLTQTDCCTQPEALHKIPPPYSHRFFWHFF